MTGSPQGDFPCGRGTLHWRAWRAPGDASSPPALLVHGFAQSAATWEDVAPLLARRRLVVALELVGHGASSRPADEGAYGLREQGQALIRFIEPLAARAGRPVVAGYSMGGRVALAALMADAGAFSRSVAGLLLESAGLGSDDAREVARAEEEDRRRARLLRDEGVEAFMRRWEELPLFASQRALAPQARRRVRAQRLDNDAHALAATLEGAGQHAMPPRAQALEALEALAAGGVPVAYVAGALDEKYASLAAALPVCVRVQVVEGAGHDVHLEAPEAFVRAVEALG